MVVGGHSQDASHFLKEYGPSFEDHHGDELRQFQLMTLPQHVFDNPTAKLYRSTKYRLPINNHVYYTLTTFLETNAKAGGTVILYILQTYCEIRETTRGPMDQFSFETIINQARTAAEEPDFEEGITGAFTGVSNKAIMHNNALLKLGPMTMDSDLAQEVRAELEDEDTKHPPELGKPSLVEEFDRTIKREDSLDAPSRNDIPLPPPRSRDIAMEVQKIKENRDRFKIESRSGGVGPAVSVCMFTFHNTLDA